MSYHTWSVDGFGFCSSDIHTTPERIRRLLLSAPKIDKRVRDDMFARKIYAPTIDDYIEYDQDEYTGLGYFLIEVICEVEQIRLIAADNFNSDTYVLYCPSYPWEDLLEGEIGLTKEKLSKIFFKYIRMLTDEEINISFQSVENGG